MSLFPLAIHAMERGLVPDAAIRQGIRWLCRQRLVEELAHPERRAALLAELHTGPVAPVPEAANAQHYELPAEFMRLALGPHLKYSCCWYETGTEDLPEAEAAMLALTCERAQLDDGQRILELGCGWGSLTLTMARRYPGAAITAVSNSSSQRAFILGEARRRGLTNVDVLTADMNDFQPPGTYDRVVSVEMFEHMRNTPELLRRVATWLVPGGRLFLHVFCHRELAYPFVDAGDTDWMARYFFTGGLMPSQRLLVDVAPPSLRHDCSWTVDGRHYERTCNQWLENLDRSRSEALRLLQPVYGAEAAVWLQRWHVFYMACAELFGYARGSEWRVVHHRFTRHA